jgi:hypothetical protein
MMERASDLVTDDLADAQVGAQMPAIGRHHGGLTALAPVGKHAAVEEVTSD